MPSALDSAFPLPVLPRSAKRSRPGLVGGAALVAGVLASSGLGTSPAAAVTAPNAVSAAGPAPGTIFVANAGSSDGSGGSGNGSVTAYRPGATGNARPELLITAGVNGPASVAFDRSGDLWVANLNIATVVEYSRAELSKASPVPTVTISVNASAGFAFDPSGELWMASDFAVDELTKAQLAKSGSPRPAVTLASAYCDGLQHSRDCPMAFDRSGDMWGGGGAYGVDELTKAQLAKSGSPAPRVSISSLSLDHPTRSTFDSAGELWAANRQGTTVVEFTKAQLAKSGSPNAWVTVSSEPASEGLDDPGDVAFDLTGDLLVANAGKNEVVEFAKAQLAKSGSQRPAKDIAGPATGLNWPWSVAVEP